MRIYHQHIGANVSVLAERKAAHLEKMVGLFTAAIAGGQLRPVDPACWRPPSRVPPRSCSTSWPGATWSVPSTN